MFSRSVSRLQRVSSVVASQCKRNIGVSAVLAQKAAAKTPSDPIQALFLEKIRDYASKSKAAGGKLVDATPEQEKKLQASLDRVDAMYGKTGPEWLNVPAFSFNDPTLQPVGAGVEIKPPKKAEGTEGEEIDDGIWENKPYWRP